MKNHKRQNLVSRGMVTLLTVMLVMLAATGTYAQNRSAGGTDSTPFGVGPGQYVEIGTTNSCSRDTNVQLGIFGTIDGGDVIGGEALASRQEALSKGQGLVLRYPSVGSVSTRTQLQARLRNVCAKRPQGQSNSSNSCLSIQIVDANTNITVLPPLQFDCGCDCI